MVPVLVLHAITGNQAPLLVWLSNASAEVQAADAAVAAALQYPRVQGKEFGIAAKI